MEDKMKTNIKKPIIKKEVDSILERRFKSGGISASIFSKEIETEYGKKKLYNVNIQKSYPIKDSKGTVTEWKYTHSFGKNDMIKVETVMRAVMTYLFLDEDEEQKEEEEEEEE